MKLKTFIKFSREAVVMSNALQKHVTFVLFMCYVYMKICIFQTFRQGSFGGTGTDGPLS